MIEVVGLQNGGQFFDPLGSSRRHGSLHNRGLQIKSSIIVIIERSDRLFTRCRRLAGSGSSPGVLGRSQISCSSRHDEFSLVIENQGPSCVMTGCLACLPSSRLHINIQCRDAGWCSDSPNRLLPALSWPASLLLGRHRQGYLDKMLIFLSN